MVVTLPEALSLAVGYFRESRLDEAEQIYRQILQLDANVPEAVHHLGVIAHQRGRFGDAIQLYRRTIVLRPDYADPYSNLGAALRQSGEPDQARVAYETALKLNPNFPQALGNLGKLLASQGDVEGAIRCFQRLITLEEVPAEVHFTLGQLFVSSAHGRYEEAVQCFRRAIALESGNLDAHVNLAFALLALGEYPEGFQEYEYRWGFPGFQRPPLTQPTWAGEPLAGKTILLVSEQGLGDTLQFARLAGLVKSRGARVLLRCQRALVQLMASFPAVDMLVAEGDPIPPFDVYSTLLSLPTILGLKLEDVPQIASIPYLRVDPALIDHWRIRLGPRKPGELRVGLVWQGNPTNTHDRNRSIPLASLLPLASVPGIHLVSLQRVNGLDQIEPLRDRLRLTCFSDEPGHDAFQDTAALMSLMDVVVSIDSAPAHLSGAIGVRTWLLASKTADWRWLLNREDSPWYPTLRIFRQTNANGWSGVVERIVSELNKIPRKEGETFVTAPLSLDDVISLALRYLREDRPELAREIGRQIREADPGNPAGADLLGSIAYESRQIEEAITFFQEAIEIEPSYAEAHYHLGLAFAQANKPQEALESYERALQFKPDHWMALKKLVSTLLVCRQFDEAIARIESSIAVRPGFSEPYVLMGDAWGAQGKIDESIHAYLSALERSPSDLVALNQLGQTLLASGRYGEALEVFRHAIEVDPKNALAYDQAAHCSHANRQFEEESIYLRQAVELSPNQAEYHFRLGNSLKQQARFEEGINSFQRVIELRPESAGAFINLGNCYLDQSNPGKAIEFYRMAVHLEPGNPNYLVNCGNAVYAMGDVDGAISHFKAAINIDSACALAWYSLGNAYREHGHHREAIEAYLRQIEHPRASDHKSSLAFEPYINLGVCYSELDETESSIAATRRALEIDPNSAFAQNNLANYLKIQGDYSEAVRYYEQCLEIDPTYSSARFNYSILQLTLGDYIQGFQNYEYRWSGGGVPKITLSQPKWSGEPIAGKTIVLLSEQGLGDTIQFVRFISQVKDKGVQVILNCPKALTGLLADFPGVDHLVREGDSFPQFDFYAPLMSLPSILGTQLEDIPGLITHPYLSAKPEYLEYWQDRFGPNSPTELRVGIAWQGNPLHKMDRQRSIPLRTFLPLTRVPGIRLFSFQKFHGVEQISDLKYEFPLICLDQESDRESDSFLDSAAQMALMDVMVTVDSAPVHLAGALGVPTFLPCSLNAEWRWLTEREDSPWYPSIRIFRQSKLNQWDEVFERIAKELTRLAEKKRRHS